MLALLQRVAEARVEVKGELRGAIGREQVRLVNDGPVTIPIALRA